MSLNNPNIEFKKGTYVLTKSMDIGEITSLVGTPVYVNDVKVCEGSATIKEA